MYMPLKQAIIALSVVTLLVSPGQMLYAEDQMEFNAIHVNDKGIRWWAYLIVEGNKISGNLHVWWQEKRTRGIKCKKTKLKKDGKFKLWCKGETSKNRSLTGNLEQAKLTATGGAGGALFRFVSGEDLQRFNTELEQNPDLTTDEFLSAK